jgi:predicted helicase
MQFQDILDKYRKNAHSKSDLGTKFEELIGRFLLTDPVYKSIFEKVYLWKDFPAHAEMGGHDTGIDIVAKTKDGEYWAIQCKCYSEDHTVSKADLDTFLATSGRKFHIDREETAFAIRAIIATTDNWSKNAVDAKNDQTIPVVLIGLNVLRDSTVDWDEIEKGVHGAAARKDPFVLRDHQKDALDNAVEHYRNSDRGSMIMACGTGKTFTSLKIAEKITTVGRGRCVLFLAPSIALVGQTLREWTANSETELNTICVCSDPKVSKKYSEDDIGERVEDLGVPATTDPQKILSQYRSGKNLTVVFSTYQSIDSIIAAQVAGLPAFDLVVCDEAHRTTGVIDDRQEESYFTKVHSNENLKANKRLYMTATPRLYGAKGKEDAKKESVVLCSMDDESLYGKEFYRIGFGKAVELKLLSDYKVLILTTDGKDIPDIVKKHWTNGGKEIDADNNCKIWGCMNALAKNIAYDETLKNTDPGKMRSAVSFCRTISRSKWIANKFNEMADMPESPIKLAVDHIDGSMNAIERERRMNWLKTGGDECRILSNVRCLSEGVDVPALDAVMFMDSKGSMVDVVQSVGRVMRKAPGKEYGYIIIPIVTPDDQDAEEALNDNDRYKVVWQVLRALRSHDERLDAEINTLQYSRGNANGHVHIARLGAGPLNMEVGLNNYLDGQYTLDDFGNALLARLVLKVGDREYIENWARDVAKVMPKLMDRLTQICGHSDHGYKQYKPAFNRYFKGLKACVNDNVTESDAINMLAQQIITKPIFTALFGDDRFVTQNSVSQTIDAMLAEIDAKDGLSDIDHELEEFHDSVERTLSRIDTTEGKQKVITSLYEKFFKNAFPKDQSINGVVYTPQEIVDFIIRSAAGVLKKEFGIDINDENVNVLDPFTGTGTFIARLMETGTISKENLERKFRNELFANEITLLAYYIAAVNIENTFTRLTGSEEYVPFNHILLTDTFNIKEICRGQQTSLDEDTYFKKNIGRIREEASKPITVIIGNPPYGANQKSANDDAKKRTYRNGVDGDIEFKYLDSTLFDTKIGNVNSVYDNYIRAFRWSTDRIGNEDGVIAFVTPNGWLTGSAFVGFRKCIEKEFAKIFVFNLRGDQNGQNWREEGEKVFGQGSKIGISITLLVERKDFKGKAKVLYVKTKDCMKRQEKFDLLTQSKSFADLERKGSLEALSPKDNGDWIIERNENFQKLIPLAGDTHKKFDKHCEKTVFVGYSQGYGTARDAWSYNYAKDRVSTNMVNMINEYNSQLENEVKDVESTKIKWETTLDLCFERRQKLFLKLDTVVLSVYRPFSKRWFYSDKIMVHRVGQNPLLFPTPNAKNLLICVAGVGVKKDFSCLITDKMTDLEIVGKSQCFPLYWYENSGEERTKRKQSSLFDDTDTLVRHDGISDYALNLARQKYGSDVTKEDIFYYVYGYLHHPEYREAFGEDLKLSLPRIDFVETLNDFRIFSQAGRDLAELHLSYENVKAPDTVKISGVLKIEELLNDPKLCQVTKMKILPEERKIIYNQYVTIENIPSEAFEYKVNGRSALGWLVDQYQYSVDKESGIINDPNEFDGGSYVLNLVLSIIGVSVKTVEIVKGLPHLGFDDGQ